MSHLNKERLTNLLNLLENTTFNLKGSEVPAVYDIMNSTYMELESINQTALKQAIDDEIIKRKEEEIKNDPSKTMQGQPVK